MDPHDPVRGEAPLLTNGALREMEESLGLGAFFFDVFGPEEGFVKGKAQVLNSVGEREGELSMVRSG